MKEYIVKADFITEGNELVLPDIVSELILCKDCKYNDAQKWVDCTLMPQMFGKTADNNFCSQAEPKVTS